MRGICTGILPWRPSDRNGRERLRDNQFALRMRRQAKVHCSLWRTVPSSTQSGGSNQTLSHRCWISLGELCRLPRLSSMAPSSSPVDSFGSVRWLKSQAMPCPIPVPILGTRHFSTPVNGGNHPNSWCTGVSFMSLLALHLRHQPCQDARAWPKNAQTWRRSPPPQSIQDANHSAKSRKTARPLGISNLAMTTWNVVQMSGALT
jgi:hypothetical protein